MIYVFRDYGISWDEPEHNAYGKLVLDYYLSNRDDTRFLMQGKVFGAIPFYGSFFDLLCAVANRFLPFDEYLVRHFINSLFGLFGIFACYRIGKFVNGELTGIVCAILIAICPIYFGHMFNNPKDIPFAALYAWAIYYLMVLSVDYPNLKFSNILFLSIFTGLLIGIRYGGLLIPFYSAIILVCFLILPIVQKKDVNMPLKGIIGSIIFFMLTVGLIVLIFWPILQFINLMELTEIHNNMSKFPFDTQILYNAKYLYTYELPLSYILVHTIIQLPELILIGFITLIVLFKNYYRINIGLYVLLFSAVFPFLLVPLLKPNFYDGSRHYLFVVPVLVCLSGIGLCWFWDLIRHNRNIKIIVYLFIIVWTGLHLYGMIKMHPYQYVYYNIFVGGIQAAGVNYEADYWGHSFSEAIKELESYLVQKDGESFHGNIYRIHIAGPWRAAEHFFPQNFKLVHDPNHAQYVLATTRWHIDQIMPGIIIFTVKRLGVVMAVGKEISL
jgi:hypothetical protein